MGQTPASLQNIGRKKADFRGAVEVSVKAHDFQPILSEAKLAMRAQADKFEAPVIRLAVDQNEIRPDVAVAVIVSFAGQGVIEIPAR